MAVAPSRVAPFTFNVPIVDPKTGLPSPQFSRQLQQLVTEKQAVAATADAAVPASALLAQIEAAAGGDPGADALLWWDHTNNTFHFLKIGTGLSISAGALDAAGGGGVSYEGGPPTPPALASLTWVNQSTTTAANGSRALVVSASALGAGTLSLLTKAAPAAPFDVYMRAEMVGIIGTTPQVGLVLRNSTSGKFIDLTLFNSASIIGQRFSSPTVNPSNWYAGGTLQGPDPARWLRFNVTATTITGYLSSNGLDWISLATEAMSTFLTSIDQVGISIGAQVGQCNALVSYFGTVAPS